MNLEYEKARRALEKLLEWFKSEVKDANLNEAETRFHLIDEIVLNCLGWDKNDIKVEKRYENKYTDYEFYCPMRSLILEAKREGVFFELPAGHNSLDVLLKTLCKDNLDIENAIKQTMSYCQERGTILGIVSNGYQFICFLASRTDGEPPLEGRAVIFSSLEIMLANFQTFWNYCSKAGIQEKRLVKHLKGIEVSPLPPKFSSTIPGYPGLKNRNDLQIELQNIGELVIEDISKVKEIEKDFIRECFCTSGALSEYAAISRSLLENRYAAIMKPKTEGIQLEPAMVKKKINIPEKLLNDNISKRPILLLGDVGVGKTMFIRYLTQVVASDFMSKTIMIYIDFGTKAALTNDIKEFFLEDFRVQLSEKYNIDIHDRKVVHGVYHSELETFEKTIYGDLKDSSPEEFKKKKIEFLENKILDKEKHLKSCIYHIIYGQKKPIVLFLDNADQRDKKFQEDAFFIAQEIAADWPITVFFSVRPQTYHRSKRFGALSGYHPKAFSIKPPMVNDVLNKRLSFALKIAKGEAGISSLGSTIVSCTHLHQYLEILISSFKTNDDLISFIDNICNGNIRLALELVATFIGSGHVDTRKILNIDADEIGKKRRYRIPLHEFLRAVTYGDTAYYDPLQSPITNLFDLSMQDGKEHFLLPTLIEYVNNMASTGSKGFVELAKIYGYGQMLGFAPAQIESGLLKALDKKLLESETRQIPGEEDEDVILPNLFRITSVGAYHIFTLVKLFTYIDAIIVDTPMLDKDYREKMPEADTIAARLERSKIFCAYLDSQWEYFNKNSASYDWPTISTSIKDNINRIEKKIS